MALDGCDQAIAAWSLQQGVIDDGEVDLAAPKNPERFRCRCGFGRHDAASAPAQLLQQTDAKERRRRGDQDRGHATAAVLR